MSDSVTVDVAEGTLKGSKATSISGGSFYSFKAVPYAKPPVGPLRFKVAQPLEPWSGVRDALQEISCCTQFDLFQDQYAGTEDCLYLNIYSPQLPKRGAEVWSRRLPVMVWLHGGGYVSGTGSAMYFGPDYLVDQGVVVVTIYYRLGILGFLYLNDDATSGNLGLKDQVAALRWIQKNIAMFGGDPDNVTIFGESAGGASVHMHMLSPMSEGLFSRAIGQSGAAFNPWGIEHHPREAAFRVAAALGFTGNKSEELVEFLRGVDHMELVKAANEHGLSEQNKHRIMKFAFVPTVEVESEGMERFLPTSPVELLEAGHYNDVPYMTGVTDREGLVAWKFVDLGDPEVLSRIEQDFGKVVLPELRLPEGYKKTDEVISKLRHFFLQDKHLSGDTLSGFIDLCSDMWFTEGVLLTAKKMVQNAKAPVYLYRFSFDGKMNMFKKFINLNYPGACHADEVGYLFNVEVADMEKLADPQAKLTRTRMLKMWTNFAKTGNPTPEVDSQLPVKWEPHTTNNPCFLEIDEELSLRQNMSKERTQFWEEFYGNL